MKSISSCMEGGHSGSIYLVDECHPDPLVCHSCVKWKKLMRMAARLRTEINYEIVESGIPAFSKFSNCFSSFDSRSRYEVYARHSNARFKLESGPENDTCHESFVVARHLGT